MEVSRTAAAAAVIESASAKPYVGSGNTYEVAALPTRFRNQEQLPWLRVTHGRLYGPESGEMEHCSIAGTRLHAMLNYGTNTTANRPYRHRGV